MMAFEPDPENFAALQSYLSAEPRLDGRATAYRAALGARRGRLQFAALATSSSSVSQSGGCEVDCVTLDEVLAAERPTLVKMDIEGGERDALMGGSEILRKHAPLVAVCIYHCQSDLWKLPYMLHELQPEHRILLRQHGVDGWELVCYSVPKGRLM